MKSNEKCGRCHILLILTGGTICSFADENGERDSNAQRALSLVVKNFREGTSPFRSEEDITFDIEMPLDILSENMTTTHWNTLINKLRTYDYSKYDGAIILHGTDTLAYTSSLLSILMAGTKIPVIMVSSQLPLYEEMSNGNANFRAAAELIANGIEPNIYAVYRNSENVNGREIRTMYVHYAAHLFQCANRSDNFHSIDMMEVSGENAMLNGKSSGDGEMQLYTCPSLTPCILRITPYVGISYDWFNLDGVRAVMHGTYHSSTMSVNPYGDSDRHRSHPVLSLKKRCDEHDPPIPFYIEPCNEEAYNYKTTGIILRAGARTIWRMTPEMAYVKLLIGCSADLRGAELEKYLNTEFNGEFVY